MDDGDGSSQELVPTEEVPSPVLCTIGQVKRRRSCSMTVFCPSPFFRSVGVSLHFCEPPTGELEVVLIKDNKSGLHNLDHSTGRAEFARCSGLFHAQKQQYIAIYI